MRNFEITDNMKTNEMGDKISDSRLTMEAAQNKDSVSGVTPVQDSGRAWVVAIAALINTFIGVGMYRCLGIFVVELTDVFDAPATTTSLIFTSVAVGFCFSAVVFIGGIGDIVHERALIAASGLLACVGFIATFFSSTVQQICAQGFCLGASIQIANASGLGIVGKYFDKRRSIANGIVMSGVSLGVIVFPPVTRWLLDEYTYRGTALIFAGLSLNSIVCGALMPPIEGQPKVVPPATGPARHADGGEVPEANIVKTKRMFRKSYPDVAHESSAKIKEIATKTSCTEHSSSVHTSTRNGHSNAAYEYEMDHRPAVPASNCVSHHRTIEDPGNPRSVCSRLGVALREFAFTNPKQRPGHESVGKTLLLGLTIFKNPLLAFVQSFMFLSTAGNECMLQFYPAFTTETGMSAVHTATLMSIVGAGDLISRLLLGALGDCHLMERYKLAMIPQFVLGSACFLARFATEFWSQGIFAAIVGLNYGAAYAYHGVLLADFFGVPNLSRLLGVTNVMCGLALATGSTFIGYLRDSTGSYHFPVQAMGLTLIGGGVSLLVAGILHKCRRRTQDAYDLENETRQV